MGFHWVLWGGELSWRWFSQSAAAEFLAEGIAVHAEGGGDVGGAVFETFEEVLSIEASISSNRVSYCHESSGTIFIFESIQRAMMVSSSPETIFPLFYLSGNV